MKCGLSNADHVARHGKSLHVHRLTPGSVYTVEGCVTLCIPCHGPEPKRPLGTVFEKSKYVLIKPGLLKAANGRCDELVQRLPVYVNDALRMRLEAEGHWPPARA